MNSMQSIPLVVGEIFLDFTVTNPGKENKLRLGGIAHAARGYWALGIPFSAAVVLPSYLVDTARKYFGALGCIDFYVLGEVVGAPNLTVIMDATEVADQGYETLLRDEKVVTLSGLDLINEVFQDILIFPGSYDLAEVCSILPATAWLHLDVAYDFYHPGLLAELPQTVRTILISTSRLCSNRLLRVRCEAYRNLSKRALPPRSSSKKIGVEPEWSLVLAGH